MQARVEFRKKSAVKARESRIFSSSAFEKITPVPPETGTGMIQSINTRPGIGLVNIQHEITPGSFEAETGGYENKLAIAFQTSGREMMSKFEEGRETLTYGPGDTFAFSTEATVNNHYPGKQSFAGTVLLLDREFLVPFLMDIDLRVPNSLRRSLESGGMEPFLEKNTITPEMSAAIHRLRDCPYQGTLKRIFVESKALELTVLRLEQLFKTRNTPRRAVGLLPRELKSVFAARDVLNERIHNPPSVLELAGIVGLTYNRLGLAFRLTFGANISNYIRRKRLEENPHEQAGGKADLSERETQVLRLMALGYTAGVAADELGITVHTVRRHIERIYYKLEVHSKSEAILRARRLGLLRDLFE